MDGDFASWQRKWLAKFSAHTMEVEINHAFWVRVECAFLFEAIDNTTSSAGSKSISSEKSPFFFADILMSNFSVCPPPPSAGPSPRDRNPLI